MAILLQTINNSKTTDKHSVSKRIAYKRTYMEQCGTNRFEPRKNQKNGQ